MLISYKLGQASVILRVKLRDSSVTTGAGMTGLTSTSTGLRIAAIADVEATTTAYTQAGSTIEAVTTLGTFLTPTATKCRFKELDATSHKGVYEIQFDNTRLAVSGAKSLTVSISGVTNLAECDFVIPLTQFDPYNPTAVSDGVIAAIVESNGSVTLKQAMSIIYAFAAGITSNSGSTIKDPTGTTTRIVATIDGSNNRTAMTITPTV